MNPTIPIQEMLFPQYYNCMYFLRFRVRIYPEKCPEAIDSSGVERKIKFFLIENNTRFDDDANLPPGNTTTKFKIDSYSPLNPLTKL